MYKKIHRYHESNTRLLDLLDRDTAVIHVSNFTIVISCSPRVKFWKKLYVSVGV